jgi:hypothetical protein
VALDGYGRAGVVVLSAGLGLVALVFTLATYRREPVSSSIESVPVR